MSGGVRRRWGVRLAVLLLTVLAGAASAADGAKPPRVAASKPAPVAADATKPVPATDAAKPDGTSTNTMDEGERLLAERSQKRGPLSPGLDPAFLVLPRAAERSHMAETLLTPEVRTMTARTLDFLARAQATDGSWSDSKYRPSNAGVTALCCLAFMSEGSRPNQGRFGKSITRGLEFILKSVTKGSGVIAGPGTNPDGPMYEHALSTLALLMAYGDMPWKPEMQEVVSGAVEAVKKGQRLDGGWRYNISNQGDSDMSVTANVLWVLRTAKKAGFTVSAESVGKGVKYIEQCANPDGTFRYRYFGLHASPSLGGTGIIGLCNNGSLDHVLIPPARDRIAYDYRRYTVDDLRQRRYFMFGAFYASLAVYSCGDDYYVPWFRKAAEVMATMQRKDGELWDEFDNVVYPTAMAAIILQGPIGYLPLYER